MFRSQYPIIPHATATRVRRRPPLDFSLTGVIYVAMMLFMGLAAINSQANLLFGMFGLMIGILLVSGIISRLVLKRLRVVRVLPENGRVGHPLSITYEMTNQKRFWPSFSVSVSELDGVEAFTLQPQCYMLHAAPRTTALVPALVVPKRRGLHELNHYQVATSFPFGFVKRAITEGRKDVILVFPPAGRVNPAVLNHCRSADVTGEAMRPQAGGADEFYGVKEYRAGDNPRWIYWRRSARSGTLVSKEMTKVSPPRILLLVDTFLGSSADSGAHAAVERCIAMAASLATFALEQGLSVGLCVFAEDWVLVQPTRGKRHREDLLSVLARLPRNSTRALPELLEHCQSVLNSGTTPILFTPYDVQMGIAQNGRSGMIVIPADSQRASQWFQFEPGIDFSICMPPAQQPPQAAPATRRRRRKSNRANVHPSNPPATSAESPARAYAAAAPEQSH